MQTETKVQQRGRLNKESLHKWKLGMQLNQAHVGYQRIIRELSQKCGEYEKYFRVDDRDKDAGVWPILFRSNLVFPEGIIGNPETRHAYAAHVACKSIPTEALEGGVMTDIQKAMNCAAFIPLPPSDQPAIWDNRDRAIFHLQKALAKLEGR